MICHVSACHLQALVSKQLFTQPTNNGLNAMCRDHFVYALIQWETALQCNVSHWLGAHTKWSVNAWPRLAGGRPKHCISFKTLLQSKSISHNLYKLPHIFHTVIYLIIWSIISNILEMGQIFNDPSSAVHRVVHGTKVKPMFTDALASCIIRSSADWIWFTT